MQSAAQTTKGSIHRCSCLGNEGNTFIPFIGFYTGHFIDGVIYPGHSYQSSNWRDSNAQLIKSNYSECKMLEVLKITTRPDKLIRMHEAMNLFGVGQCKEYLVQNVDCCSTTQLNLQSFKIKPETTTNLNFQARTNLKTAMSGLSRSRNVCVYLPMGWQSASLFGNE